MNKRALYSYEVKAPDPVMLDPRWHQYGPRVFDRVVVHPSVYWAVLRDEPIGASEAWDGLIGTVVMECPFGPWVGVLVDKPPRRHRHRKFEGRTLACWHIWHPDELELLALRVPGEYRLGPEHSYLRVVK